MYYVVLFVFKFNYSSLFLGLPMESSCLTANVAAPSTESDDEEEDDEMETEENGGQSSLGLESGKTR